MAMYEAHTVLYKKYQFEHISLMEVYNNFKNKVEVIEHQSGCIGQDEGLLNVITTERGKEEETTVKKYIDGEDLTMDQKAMINEIKRASRDRYLACAFLKLVTRRKYIALLNDLENKTSWGQSVMPRNLGKAHEFCVPYKATEIEAARPKRLEPGSSDGINFHQRGSTAAGRDGVTHENITCYK